ncbi:hypothetical protein E2C01_062540 [Portunus trituberculatus]|uniref:Uncharacterized protein n=1 Tax=Portunus trituberculatus TaxID=210409 RepID=A0A5B7H853_PORTR|nr:hypothetical protein [Portunus trituberculatus]
MGYLVPMWTSRFKKRPHMIRMFVHDRAETPIGPAREEQASHVGGGAEPISTEDSAVPPQPANYAHRSPTHYLLRLLHTNRPAEAFTEHTPPPVKLDDLNFLLRFVPLGYKSWYTDLFAAQRLLAAQDAPDGLNDPDSLGDNILDY